MAIEAARQLFSASLGARAYLFKQVVIHKALLIPLGDKGVETQLHLRPSNEPQGHFASWTEFRLYAFESDAWSEICQGYIAIKYDDISDSEVQQIRERYQQGADRCSIECFAGSLYSSLDAHGITFGPRFRGLKNIRVNNFGEATATSSLLAWQTGTVDVDIQSHVIHPIALDAVLQTSLSALSQGGRKPIATMIPTAIPSLCLFVNKDEISTCHPRSIDEIGNVEIFAKAKPRGLRSSEMSVTAIHSKSSQPFLTATIECTSASSIPNKIQHKDSDGRRCFYMDWKPDVDLMDRGNILSYCSSRAREPVNVSNGMLEEKELICYISLQQLSDTKLSSEIMKCKPHLQRYLSWMKHRLRQTVSEKGESYAAKLRGRGYNESYLTQLYRKVESSDSEGKLIIRVAQGLLKIFSGDLDVLELLFSDDLLSEFYRDMHARSKAYRNIITYIDALAHKRPDLKIIEIGAGTGGATRQLLDVLAQDVATKSFNHRFAEYVFTDVSPDFFERARTEYKSIENRMTFATLNIEIDPIEQGFEEGIYGLVVASNVGIAYFLEICTIMMPLLTDLRSYTRQKISIPLFRISESCSSRKLISSHPEKPLTRFQRRQAAFG